MAKKVLIVDYTPGGLALLREALTQPQFILFEASSGRQAIEIHRRERVDLFVMDLQMPGMDGEQVTRAIRADRALRDVSILLFGEPRPGLRERCLTAGANAFLPEPFKNTDLVTRVESLINVATRKHTALLAHVNTEDDGPAIDPFVARIVNVSTSGLLLEATAPLAKGRIVCVKFFVPGATVQLSVTATVARRTDTGGSVRWGVRFLAIDQAARRILRDYVGG